MSSSSIRFRGLDAWRGFSALLIVLYHFTDQHKQALNEAGWFLIHPLWGAGFFVLINRMVVAELGWMSRAKLPSFVAIFAPVGLFSYSIYLTHELMIMQSWRWTDPAALYLVNGFIVVLPATLVFAWVYFWFCERPFMVRRGVRATEPATSSTNLLKLLKEGFPSRAFPTPLRTRLFVRLRRGADDSESGAEPAAAAVGPASRFANTYADSIAVADGQN